jgi:hypothetical protein
VDVAAQREVTVEVTVVVVVTAAGDVDVAVDAEVQRATRRSGSLSPSSVVW